MTEKKQELILIYDSRQMRALQEYVAKLAGESPAAILLSLDAEVDMLLRDANIPFLSARDFKRNTLNHLLYSDAWALSTNGGGWEWFSYRGVHFSHIFGPTLQAVYLESSYDVEVLCNVLQQNKQVGSIVVLAPEERVVIGGAFIARYQRRMVADVASIVGEYLNVEVVKIQEDANVDFNSQKLTRFTFKRQLFGVAISILNTFVALVRPRGRVSILASDYWRNISPVMEHIPGVEVVLCDRKEILNARIRNVWKYRMRFMHAESFTSNSPSIRQKAYLDIQTSWSQKKGSMTDVRAVAGVPMLPRLQNLIDEIVKDAVPSLLEKIDETYGMLEALRPDIVMLRATVSQQWHFPLLALIAKENGIPSVELLHGMEYPGPGSIDKWHVASHLGVYGKHTQKQMVSAGFDEEHLPIIGSPRFDLYSNNELAHVRAEAKKATDSVVIFVTAPDYYVGITFDTYEVEDYFRAVAQALRPIPGVHAIIKLRPGPRRESFYRRAIAEAFKEVPHTIAQYEALRTVFPKADFAISCQSTVTLEALQCGVPLVLFAATPIEKQMLEFNFNAFVNAGAVKLCVNTEQLSQTVTQLANDHAQQRVLSEKSAEFLAKEFAFDGKSADRAAAFLQEVIKKGA